jgi:Uma2 family endonuclease
MSTETILTHSAYLQLPEDDPHKYEMLWGTLYVTASPRRVHQRAQVVIGAVLEHHVHECGLGEVVGPIDLYRDEGNYVQPDLSFFSTDQVPLLTEQAIRVPPRLVVEILSPSTARLDREDKRRWYAELGVLEYWLVDCDARTMEVIDLRTGEARRDDPVGSGVLPELVVPLQRIFG